MIAPETQIRLTAEGKLMAWQQGAQTFESAIRDMSNGLVVAATAINDMVAGGHDFEECLELGRQWHQDLRSLPTPAQRLTLTRMCVAGIREPHQYTLEEV